MKPLACRWRPFFIQECIMRNSRLLVLAGLVSIGLTTSSQAGDKPDVKKILKAADDATKALTAVTYDAEYHAEGGLKAREPRVTGKVKAQEGKRGMLSGLVGGPRNLIFFEGSVVHPGASEAESFKAATDAKFVYSIDEQEKTFTKGESPQAQRLLAPGFPLLMQEYIHPTPFSDELNAETATHEGTKEIDGQKCDVILVVYSGNQGRARWYFSQKDHLPRRVDRLIADGEIEGARVLTVTNLDADPTFAKDDFKLTAPEGYETREFQAPRNPGAPELLRVRSTAPEWELKDADGKTVTLASLRGNVVVLDFWATWCGPCKMAMPGLQKVHEEFKGKPVKIIGVSCWEKGGDPAAYMKKKKYTYDLLVKGDKVADDYKVTGIPTFYVIDQDGKIAFTQSGMLPGGGEEELIKIIKKNLKATED
jgi:thiol-disulfide isomerase/thioredoxin